MESNTEIKESKLKPPIFITGCSRSGTTLLRNILEKNNQIYGLKGETFLFSKYRDHVESKITDLLNKNNQLDLLSIGLTIIFYGFITGHEILNENRVNEHIVLIANEIKKLKELDKLKDIYSVFDFCTRYLTLKDGKFRWIEKTPSHIFTTKLILNHYPNAKIIQIHRDPRAVYSSWKRSYFQFFTKSNMYRFLSEWITSVNIGLNLKASIPEQFYLIRYSDLISNPKDETKKLCNFLNEEFNPEMLDITIDNSSYINLIGEKGFSIKPDEQWQQILTSKEKLLIDKTTKKLRKRLNYPDSGEKINLKNAFPFLLFRVVKYYEYYIDPYIFKIKISILSHARNFISKLQFEKTYT